MNRSSCTTDRETLHSVWIEIWNWNEKKIVESIAV